MSVYSFTTGPGRMDLPPKHSARSSDLLPGSYTQHPSPDFKAGVFSMLACWKRDSRLKFHHCLEPIRASTSIRRAWKHVVLLHDGSTASVNSRVICICAIHILLCLHNGYNIFSKPRMRPFGRAQVSLRYMFNSNLQD